MRMKIPEYSTQELRTDGRTDRRTDRQSELYKSFATKTIYFDIRLEEGMRMKIP